MYIIIGWLVVYLIGFILSFKMSAIEIHADKEIYTKGDQLLIFALSLLSFLWVLVILIITWVKRISATGYWNTPVKGDGFVPGEKQTEEIKKTVE